MSQPSPLIAHSRPYWSTQPTRPISPVRQGQVEVEEEVIDCTQSRYQFRNLPRRAFSSSLPQRSSAPNSISGLGRFDRSASILDTDIFKYPVKQIPPSYFVIPTPTPISIPPFPITREDYELAYVDPEMRKELDTSQEKRENNLKELEGGKVDCVDWEQWEEDRRKSREVKRKNDQLKNKQRQVPLVDLSTIDEEEDDEIEKVTMRKVKRMKCGSIEILDSDPEDTRVESGLSIVSQISTNLNPDSELPADDSQSEKIKAELEWGQKHSHLEPKLDTIMEPDSHESTTAGPNPSDTSSEYIELSLYPASPAEAEAMVLVSPLEHVSSTAQDDLSTSHVTPNEILECSSLKIIVTSPSECDAESSSFNSHETSTAPTTVLIGERPQPEQISTAISDGNYRLAMLAWDWGRTGCRAPSLSDSDLDELNSDYDFTSRVHSRASSSSPIVDINQVEYQSQIESTTSLMTSVSPNGSTASIPTME